MENIGQGPFWNELGGDIFIECKNLSSSSAAHMVHTFANKAGLAQKKLAFFVSLNGFSKQALEIVKTLWLFLAVRFSFRYQDGIFGKP